MMRAVIAALVMVIVAVPCRVAAQGALDGRWSLDRSLSEFPREIGFGTDLIPSETTGGGGSAGAQGSRRRGGAPPAAGPFSGRQETPDDAARLRLMTAELRKPSERLTIAQAAPGTISITDDQGRVRTFHPGAREDVIRLDDVPVAATARWEGARLVIVYQVEDGRQLRYTYSLTTNPSELVVDVQVVERGNHDTARRVYVPATVTETAAPQVPQPSTPTGASVPPASPAVDQRPGAELKGLTTLAVVVEEIGDASTACGLSQAALERAASKPLEDAGLTVVHRSDEDTYLYVNVMTNRAANGLCVSRYDVSVNTHTTAKLSYGSAPVLVEATLLHKGGLAGGSASSHAQSVVNGVAQYAAEFASRIRDANK